MPDVLRAWPSAPGTASVGSRPTRASPRSSRAPAPSASAASKNARSSPTYLTTEIRGTSSAPLIELARDGEVAEHHRLVRRAVVLVLPRCELDHERLRADERNGGEVLCVFVRPVERERMDRRPVVDHELVAPRLQRLHGLAIHRQRDREAGPDRARQRWDGVRAAERGGGEDERENRCRANRQAFRDHGAPPGRLQGRELYPGQQQTVCENSLAQMCR